MYYDWIYSNSNCFNRRANNIVTIMSITICIILFLCLIALAILFKPVFVSKKSLKLLLSDRKYLNTFSKKDLEVRNVDSAYNYINTNISMSVTNTS